MVSGGRAAAPPKLVTVIIDGHEYQAEAGRNMLDVALSLGFDLPFFCWHPVLGSIGACRQCAVRLYWTDREGKEKSEIAMACMTEAQEGTKMDIFDDDAVRFRAEMIELMMLSHPHDCPVCDEGGECHLQDMTVMTGHSYRRYRGRKRTFENQDLGPFVTHELNRCITCYRCTRFYNDYAGGRDFGVFGLRNRVYFGRAESGTLESEFSGEPHRGLPHRRVRRQAVLTPVLAQVGSADGAVGVPGLRPRLHDDAVGALRRAAPRAGSLQPRRQQDVPLRPRPVRLRVRERAAAGADGARGGGADGRPGRRSGRRHEQLRSSRWTPRRACCAAAAPSASARRVPRSKPTTRSARWSARPTSISACPTATTASSAPSSRSPPFVRLRLGSAADIHDADAVLVLGEDLTNTAPMLDLTLRTWLHLRPNVVEERNHIRRWNDAGSDAHQAA